MDFLALDLEVGRNDDRIHAFGAVRSRSGKAQTFHGGDLDTALKNLDAFAKGADYLLGHNLIAFDLPHLSAAKPDLRLLRLSAVDTLRLNPLAFPRHPYHHLVKHYQDGQLKRGRVNDPVHRAITALSPGDPLRVRTTQQPWQLLDHAGNVVGRLAKGYTPPPAMRLRTATVLAIVMRRRSDSEPQYQNALKCEEWEVVVPELVFQRAG